MDEDFQTDAQPFNLTKQKLCDSKSDPCDSESDDSTDLDEPEPEAERISFSNPSMDTGGVNLENTSLEIDKSTVHIGHSISQSTNISIENPASVHVDRRRISYITCPEHQKKVITFLLSL